MKNVILIIGVVIFTSFILAGCGQNRIKQKELELKEKELVLKQKELELKEKEITKKDSILTKSRSPLKAEQLKSKKEEQWDPFWILFSNAVKQKDKGALLKLALYDSEFDGGAGGESAKDWAERMVSNREWKTFIADINKGVVRDTYRGKGGKITKECALYFEFKNDKWYWAGVLVD